MERLEENEKQYDFSTTIVRAHFIDEQNGIHNTMVCAQKGVYGTWWCSKYPPLFGGSRPAFAEASAAGFGDAGKF